MPDQPHCRWCGEHPPFEVKSPSWRCPACNRWQHIMPCPVCDCLVSVERVEAVLGHPVGGSREAAGGE